MRPFLLLTAAFCIALAVPAEACDRVVRTACVGQPLDSTRDQAFGLVLAVDLSLSLHDVASRGSFSAGYGGLEILLAGPQLGMGAYTAIDLAQAGETGPALLTGAYAAWMGLLTINGVREIVGAQRPAKERSIEITPTPMPDGSAGFSLAGSF